MRVGIVVDGQAEQVALAKLVEKIRSRYQILKPLYADMQPKASAAQIVAAAADTIQIHVRKGADAVIVLLDREDSDLCAPRLANAIEEAFRRKGFDQIYVVVKDCCFENWLISDPDAIAKKSGRFGLTPRFRRSVAPNKADRVEKPLALLNEICIKTEFHKRLDACSLAEVLDPDRMARNSRSFRRFLRVAGCAEYRDQSRVP